MNHHRNHKFLYKAAAAVMILCIAAAAVVTVFLYQKRKETEAAIAARDYYVRENIADEQGEIIEYQGKRYRRNSYVKAILLLGVDRNGSMNETTVCTAGGQADGIFVVAQDTARNTVKILMIPRDTMTYITLTDIQGNVLGKDIQHLTLAYAYGDGREVSCQFMTEAVSEFLCNMTIDHYLAADINMITILNDFLGGVTVTVPSDDLKEIYPAFTKGASVTLHGQEAERFVRYRDTSMNFSAMDRMGRQQAYMTGFFRALKSRASKDSQIVTHMFDTIQDHMVTDMGKEVYLKIAMDALNTRGLTDGDFYVVPGESVSTELYDEFHADKEALTPMILELFYREIS